MQGEKVPVVALEEQPDPVQGTEVMKLPLDPSLQEGKDIESVISLSQAFPFFSAFFMLPSSASFPHPMAYEQFLPLLLFISFERNFWLRLISM